MITGGIYVQITPVDIRNKEFRKGVHGYQSSEVDKFLELVSREFEGTYAENFELKEQVEKLEQDLARYKNLENTLQQTMVLAQQTSEAVKQSAHQEAELLLREAEQDMARRLAEAQKKWDQIEEEIQQLIRKRELIRTQLKSFLHAQLDLAELYDQNFNIS